MFRGAIIRTWLYNHYRNYLSSQYLLIQHLHEPTRYLRIWHRCYLLLMFQRVLFYLKRVTTNWIVSRFLVIDH